MLPDARRARAAVVLLATLLSVGAYLLFAGDGAVLGYKDTVSHLLIGRRLVVGQETGLAQLGGIWLPLQHLCIMLLAWNDTLYLSGLAGSVFSMAAYVGTVVALYAVGRRSTGSHVAGLVAAGVFGLNVNVLFLQATPMTETLMYCGVAVAVLGVVRWCQDESVPWLFLSALTCGLLVFVRYEAWVFDAALWCVVVYASWRRGDRFLRGDAEGQGLALFFGLYMGLGLVAWLAYCQIIFGDALVWLHGDYSSKAQVSEIGDQVVGELSRTVRTYGYAVLHTIPVGLLVTGGAGLVVMAVRERFSAVWAAFLSTTAPGAFLVYGLYSGSQPMNVVEVDGLLYNLRMAVVWILPVALFTGYLAATVSRALVGLARRRGLVRPAHRGAVPVVLAAAATLVFLAPALAAFGESSVDPTDGVITYEEALQARADYAPDRAAGLTVASETDGLVLAQAFSNEWVVFPLQERLVYEGTSSEWDAALADPAAADIDVIVMRVTPGSTDLVTERLRGSDAVRRDYRLLLKTYDLRIYVRRETS
ncbi:glycosyltransferase family 39 protein [Nocardioides sp. GY 10127]|uniref:glycosyltransferase family 39 protein n=1 Tax=Nocardioides sp. GY 10127 TaxID=2569762 RepID=UPI0014580DF1|nr:glycosyltransferase family 39 protein [Nocardioides sp. GY 10127]